MLDTCLALLNVMAIYAIAMPCVRVQNLQAHVATPMKNSFCFSMLPILSYVHCCHFSCRISQSICLAMITMLHVKSQRYYWWVGVKKQ